MLKVNQLIEKFDLYSINDVQQFDRPIENSDLSRPGLEIAGFFSYYSSDRIQVLGTTEISFINQKLTSAMKKERIKQLCQPETPCIIVTRGLEIPDEIIEATDEMDIPLLQTDESTTSFMARLTQYLTRELALETNVHGGLIDVYGVGVLIVGSSGVGKSEAALELIKRGHRLVADDNVIIKRVADNILMGSSPPLIDNMLEIRGIGVIDVLQLFGAGAVLPEKRISLIINLEQWQQGKMYDRIGLDIEYDNILGIEVPKKTIPIRPGRNLAVIIEVAAMNFRMNALGINAADEINRRMNSLRSD
ncbi:HPr(Ser) kinase/phosphatase [Abyssicoccus albus]|uniref:HPr kinase/phosphorylase n=1 Tax=Abyssicoccus albus TaxID=1817405 RepID=A0A3N5CEI3_9BACL|nr:HPr(Ser) kinase/phosphatase [Abyssicoccus albus]RPF57485.1 Hpr(Ser) kinase/phosphatase [Abyssicoccus albus]